MRRSAPVLILGFVSFSCSDIRRLTRPSFGAFRRRRESSSPTNSIVEIPAYLSASSWLNSENPICQICVLYGIFDLRKNSVLGLRQISQILVRYIPSENIYVEINPIQTVLRLWPPRLREASSPLELFFSS